MEILNVSEAAKFLGFKQSYLYKLVSSGVVPYSKPNGGRLFFQKEKLAEWALSNGTTSNNEKDIKASTYVSTH